MSTRHVLRLLAAYLLASLTGCGGDEAAGPAAPPSASGAVVPIVCPTARYILTLSSPSATLIDEPQDVSLLINCGGNVRVEPDVAVDWSVTSGGGTVNGSTTARATTGADGVSRVTWKFGQIDGAQTIEARIAGAPFIHAEMSRTFVAAGSNACASAGGTNMGHSRTISRDETWTKAGSPYFSQCSPSSSCTGEITVAGGAVLTIEPGVAVCVGRLRATGGGRIVAIGTASERVHFGVRDRAAQWQGMILEAPDSSAMLSGMSVLRHAVIENPESIDVRGHPILVEDVLVRRDPAVSKESSRWAGGVGGCATFAIQQHALAQIPPSHVVRTILDGIGAVASPWENDSYGCPALQIDVAASTPPLVVSARVINSWGPGVGFHVQGAATGVSHTRLADCEVSGSTEVGIYVYAQDAADSLPVIANCNVFGNAGMGANGGFSEKLTLDARSNWWGDPQGAQGHQGNQVIGNVDASNPLAVPVKLGY